MDIEKMTKDELKNLYSNVRELEKLCDNACENALACGDMVELDRLENILHRLIEFAGIINVRIENYRYQEVGRYDNN